MADGGVGEAALLSELLPAGAANGIPMLGDIVGTGLLGDAGGVSSLLGSGTSLLPSAMTGVPAGVESLMPALQSAAPEAAGQVANQLASTLGTNQGIGAAVTPQIAPVQSAMMQAGTEAIPSTLSENITHEALADAASQYPDSARFGSGLGTTQSSSGIGDLLSGAKDWWNGLSTKEKMLYGGSAALGANSLFGSKQGNPAAQHYSGPLSRFHYNPDVYVPTTTPQPTPYQAQYTNYRGYAGGGPVEQMANANAIGQNTGFPQSAIHQGAYATPWQTPISQNVLSGTADTNVDPYTGEEKFASGGIAALGGYSDGGQMLKGPGDGMSDEIPATIAGKQPARLANDEFVVPADVVSHLGNGSPDAGAKQLYKMMDRVRQARTGKKAQGKEISPDKYMPA
jgi:hypothetical protein